jgi:hypothetical protein
MPRAMFVCTEYACTDSPEAIKESFKEGERSVIFNQIMEYIRMLLNEIRRGE